ncbi:hypothetical protein M0811_13886 [Anaeramoeba ignava]|uniref:BTB domain-containing protein n=1 Tax=Anaeramoeba ignava TaxID=1746090 RepID=A0A9Q0RHY3_ANAIG|nr:hypothetical protein M0811_13886 [Anaeramoeba ignava]
MENEVWFWGEKPPQSLFSGKKTTISIPVKLTKIPKNKQIKQISSGDLGTVILFQNGTAIEYLFTQKKAKTIQFPNIKKISSGFSIYAILTENGEVYFKGHYYNPRKKTNFFKIHHLIDDPNDNLIVDVVCGTGTIYLFTEKSTVYGIGDNNFGQLGLESSNCSEKPVLMMKNVDKIFCSNYTSSLFLLNSNQELFACGDNYHGKLGLGKIQPTHKDDSCNQIYKLTQIQNIPKGKITNVQMGYYHSIMLIEIEEENQNQNQKLYSCGEYETNGLSKKEDTFEFTEIKSSLFENDYILEIFCSCSDTLILTEKGKLIGFGSQFNSGFYSRYNPNNLCFPIEFEVPQLTYDISNYHIIAGSFNFFLYYVTPSRLEEDLIKLFRRKEFCDISFKTKNGEIIEAHKLILKYRLNQNQNEIEKLKEIISKKSIKESNQIFEMIYSNNSKINPKLYSEIKEIINSNEKIEEAMKRIYLNENEKDFIIERKEKQYKFPKLILIMRSELYRGMFLSVTEDKSNKVTDYSELSEESFKIFEYWIYSNQILPQKKKSKFKKNIKELEKAMDYFQLNQTNPNLVSMAKNYLEKK